MSGWVPGVRVAHKTAPSLLVGWGRYCWVGISLGVCQILGILVQHLSKGTFYVGSATRTDLRAPWGASPPNRLCNRRIS